MYLQQGDVIIKKIGKIEGELKKRNDHILALGETTHTHRVAVEDINKVEMFDLDERLIMRVKSPAKIEHEEHNTVLVPVGDYEIKKVREYDYFLEEVRSVQD